MSRNQARHAPKGAVRPAAKSPISRRRLWLFRTSAALLGPTVFFIALELFLRLFGYGHSDAFFLPAQIDSQPVWIQNDRFASRFLGPALARQPWPFALSQKKDPATIRIFVFGESAAFGDPQPEYGLSRMLEVLLRVRFPQTRFEVVNTALTAVNSHALLPIAREAAARQGDIWIVYAGNNEVVGPYGAGTVFGARGASRNFIRCSLALQSTRTAQWLQALLQNWSRDAGPREWGGMQMFLDHQVRLEDPLMAGVYENFRANLADVLHLGRRSGARILLSTVAVNLHDCAPFSSLHRPGLTPAQLREWEEQIRAGESAQTAGQAAIALDHFRRAETLDDRFAELQFHLGRCYRALAQGEEARRHFILARDLDTLRFRCDSRLNQIIRDLGSHREGEGIRLIDSARVIEEQQADQQLFYEHVHLSFDGNYRLARLLAEEVAKILPEPVRSSAAAAQAWASAEDCAVALAWTGSSRAEAARLILARLSDPPFTAQLNHSEQIERWNTELQQLHAAAGRPELLAADAARCRAALSQSPADWVLHMNLARLLKQQGDLAAAAESWRRVLDLLPGYLDAWQEWGGLLAQQGHAQEAAGAFSHALQIQPDSVIALTALADLEARQGDHPRAVSHLQRALKIKSWWTPAHLALGKEYETIGQPAKAEAHFQAAMKANLNTPAAHAALARFCFERGALEPAATHFAEALRLDPTDPELQVNFGVTLVQLGRRDQAFTHFQEAVRLDPQLAEAHARLGLELGRRGNDAAAVEQFGDAVRLKPDLVEARVNLAVALSKLGRSGEARDQFQEVLRRSPTNAAALRYLGSQGAL